MQLRERDAWMDGWIDRSIDRWIDAGWTDGRMDGWMHAWMHGCMDACMDGRMHKCMHEMGMVMGMRLDWTGWDAMGWDAMGCDAMGGMVWLDGQSMMLAHACLCACVLVWVRARGFHGLGRSRLPSAVRPRHVDLDRLESSLGTEADRHEPPSKSSTDRSRSTRC